MTDDLFDEHIFQRGWFNHQLDYHGPLGAIFLGRIFAADGLLGRDGAHKLRVFGDGADHV